jgi:hypothetical protein
VRLVYADGGQNPVFTGYKDVSDPEALASGPQEIVLSDRRSVSAAVKAAGADADRKPVASLAPAPVDAPAAQPPPATVIATAAPAKPSSGMLGGLTGGAKNVQRWLHLGGQEPTPLAVDATASEGDQAVPGAPLPPRRDNVHMASLHTAPVPPIRPNPAGTPADAPDSAQAQ